MAVDASKDKTEIIELLIDHNVQVNCVSMFRIIPLLLAVECNFPRVVKALVEKGNADVHILGEEENTALHFAVINGHYDITKYLLEKGANQTLRNRSSLFFFPIFLYSGRNENTMMLLLTRMNGQSKHPSTTAQRTCSPCWGGETKKMGPMEM